MLADSRIRPLKQKVQVYDTTLRDGAQAAGIAFSDTGKVRFAKALDDFGVDYIEGGYAGSNPRDLKFFADMAKETLHHARIVAFGSTRRASADVRSDPQLQGLLRAETSVCAIFGKSWLLHVSEVLRTTAENNLQMIADTVGYLKQSGRDVIFDAEHFFDGYADNPDYALEVLRTAVREGASQLTLCDTNGGRLPYEIATAVAAVIQEFPQVSIGIHAHNDSGLAVANTIEAVRSGATLIQGTVNGFGERCGNADLLTIIPSLELKLKVPCIGRRNLRKLRALSLLADELTNQRPDPRYPYRGAFAFSHKAGTHVNAVLKNPVTFEHIAPEVVGNKREILVSELAGAANIQMKAKELGVDQLASDKAVARQVLDELKSKEREGYSFESADGSFKLLMRRVMKLNRHLFEFEGFRVITEKRSRDEQCITEATVKISVDGVTELTVGEGNGPVDALDVALRKALSKFYPEISRMSLTDFRVRILDPESAARAVTRVVIESTDGAKSWGTVGVSQNIIEASWQALLDSVEYKLSEKGSKK